MLHSTQYVAVDPFQVAHGALTAFCRQRQLFHIIQPLLCLIAKLPLSPSDYPGVFVIPDCSFPAIWKLLLVVSTFLLYDEPTPPRIGELQVVVFCKSIRVLTSDFESA